MAIVYPGGIDSFPVPNSPENTSLSEAGAGGTRAHTEHHADLGAAIVALEQNTAFRNHTHGGGTGLGSSPKLIQANTHESADTDGSASSIHHTLGTGAYQAASGNHVHDYNDATRLINRPLVVCTSTTRPPLPFYGMQIWETDTNRARVWSAFQSNTANVGKYGRDDFKRTNATNLGTEYWQQIYTGPAGNGFMSMPTGMEAMWTDQGNGYNRCIARRVYAVDKETLTDDQIITWRVSDPMENTLPFTGPGGNDGYLRMSADMQSYIRIEVTDDYINVHRTTEGIAGETVLTTLWVGENTIPNCTWQATIIGYRISVYRDGVFMGSAIDADEVSNKGPAYRGWGIGMFAGIRGFGQSTPGKVVYVSIQDAIYYTSTNKWSLLSTGSIPVLRAIQGSRQIIPAGYNGAIMEWRNVIEDTFGMMNPNVSKTEINIKESGLYDISVALSWDAALFDEWAYVGIEINGLETLYYRWEKAHGGILAGGRTTNVDYSSKIRFTEGDVLRIRAKHNGGPDIFTRSASADKIDSHIEMTYLSP